MFCYPKCQEALQELRYACVLKAGSRLFIQVSVEGGMTRIIKHKHEPFDFRLKITELPDQVSSFYHDFLTETARNNHKTHIATYNVIPVPNIFLLWLFGALFSLGFNLLLSFYQFNPRRFTRWFFTFVCCMRAIF